MRTFFALTLLMMIFAACDGEDEKMDISVGSIAAMWDITETNDGSGWKKCDSLQMSRTILSEDGFCSTMGKLFHDYLIRGKFSFSDNIVILRDDYDTKSLCCTFTEVRKHSATAFFKFSDDMKLEVKMERNETQPLTYKDPVTFLNGKWILVESLSYSGGQPEVNDNGFVVFEGNKMTLQVNDETFTSSFYRLDNARIVTTDEKYIVRSEGPDKINIDSHGKSMIFRKK